MSWMSLESQDTSKRVEWTDGTEVKAVMQGASELMEL